MTTDTQPENSSTETATQDFDKAAQKQSPSEFGTFYHRMDDQTLMRLDATPLYERTTLYNFQAQRVTEDTTYNAGNVMTKDYHFSEYTTAKSMKRIWDTLVDLGGKPPELSGMTQHPNDPDVKDENDTTAYGREAGQEAAPLGFQLKDFKAKPGF